MGFLVAVKQAYSARKGVAVKGVFITINYPGLEDKISCLIY